jgi:DNA-binding response OmpR family regulator
MKILIVEDEMLIAMSLAADIEDLGYEVLGPANSVATALDLIGSAAPDLGLLDVDLINKGDGIAIAEFMLSRAIPVVFITGQTELVKRNAHLAVGYIRKPYAPEDVADSIGVVNAILQGRDPPPPRIASSFQRL